VFIDRQIKAALMIDIEVHLTLKLSKTKAEKITKCENLVLEIKNFWKLNEVSVYSVVISVAGVVTRSFLKYIENTGLTKKKHLKSWAKSSTITNVSYITQIPRRRHLILRDRMHFFLVTEPNVTDSLRHR
jgi:fructose-1,6-bisphosphatase/sedoheptulose 1,7-bisphosphatase-like protein